jgi:hypothetical protein
MCDITRFWLSCFIAPKILYYLSILSVPDEGYLERTWWRLFWVYLMKVILSVPDEGYSERTWWRLFWAYLMKVILSVTWWRLFRAYLMKVILSVTWWRLFWASPDEGYSRNWSWALNLISTFFLLQTLTSKIKIEQHELH